MAIMRLHPTNVLLAATLGLQLAGSPCALGADPVAAAAAPGDTKVAAPARDFIAENIAFEARLGSDEWRLARLSRSSRPHQELAVQGLGVTQRAFLVSPEVAGRVPAVLMIPEDQGLNTWARAMADEIAAMGYVVLVPDLLAGRGPGGGGRESFTDLRDVFAIHGRLPRTEEPQMSAQLGFWADYLRTLPQSNGKLAVVGFAWGGGRALWFATQRKDVDAAIVFYDAAPPADALAGLQAPVYGFYADIDPRVTRSLPETEAAMRRLGKHYDKIVYPGSEHMFVRLGEEPRNQNPANIEARNDSLARLQRILAGL